MFVQAVLLLREGLRHYDPGRDVLINLQQPAQFLTWRKQGQVYENHKLRYEKVPHGSAVVGVFLGDVFENTSYMGYIDGQPNGSWRVRSYVGHVLPQVKQGYTHSIYNKLFAPPNSFAELMDKLNYINALYFDYYKRIEVEFSEGGELEQDVGPWCGVLAITAPRSASKEQLGSLYSNILSALGPEGSKHGLLSQVYTKAA